jgi:hypothetical protein
MPEPDLFPVGAEVLVYVAGDYYPSGRPLLDTACVLAAPTKPTGSQLYRLRSFITGREFCAPPAVLTLVPRYEEAPHA